VAPKTNTPQQQLKLPTLVFGIVEIRRMRREVEALEDFVKQAEIREPGKQQQLPRTSRLLDALATDNNLQLLQPGHRKYISNFLHAVETEAPNIHISFAIDPSSAFTAKIVTWLRANIHPFTLLEVGVQPTVAVGCVVRTTNKVFDFSLRERFTNSQELLIKALESVTDPTLSQPAIAAENV
jgi:F0F1-type ATP synthase delta subunit